MDCQGVLLTPSVAVIRRFLGGIGRDFQQCLRIVTAPLASWQRLAPPDTGHSNCMLKAS